MIIRSRRSKSTVPSVHHTTCEGRNGQQPATSSSIRIGGQEATLWAPQGLVVVHVNVVLDIALSKETSRTHRRRRPSFTGAWKCSSSCTSQMFWVRQRINMDMEIITEEIFLYHSLHSKAVDC